MSPAESSLEFRTALLDLLWQHWAALGIAGTAKPSARSCVDLEGLILLTTKLGRADARLFDEMLDWLWHNGHAVNVQRLRNIQKTLSLGDPRVLAAIADWLTQRSALSKWKGLAAVPESAAGFPEALFLTKEGKPQPIFGEPDPLFLRRGFHRGPIRRRELSCSPNPLTAALLPWKLRALFGVQARCEVLLWLLTHGSGSPADIARASFYFPRTIEEALNEMVGSGLIYSARPGREKRFWLRMEDWSFLRTWEKPEGFPGWIDWPRLFTALTQIAGVLGRGDLGPILQASELRRVFDELQPVLMDGGLIAFFSADRNQEGADFTEVLRQDLHALIQRI